jgi:hypothetical protein
VSEKAAQDIRGTAELMENSKDMMKMQDEEFWKRLGPTLRECKAMGLDKDGMCIYIPHSAVRNEC